jgi:hypothetical protein
MSAETVPFGLYPLSIECVLDAVLSPALADFSTIPLACVLVFGFPSLRTTATTQQKFE